MVQIKIKYCQRFTKKTKILKTQKPCNVLRKLNKLSSCAIFFIETRKKLFNFEKEQNFECEFRLFNKFCSIKIKWTKVFYFKLDMH